MLKMSKTNFASDFANIMSLAVHVSPKGRSSFVGWARKERRTNFASDFANIIKK